MRASLPAPRPGAARGRCPAIKMSCSSLAASRGRAGTAKKMSWDYLHDPELEVHPVPLPVVRHQLAEAVADDALFALAAVEESDGLCTVLDPGVDEGEAGLEAARDLKRKLLFRILREASLLLRAGPHALTSSRDISRVSSL